MNTFIRQKGIRTDRQTRQIYTDLNSIPVAYLLKLSIIKTKSCNSLRIHITLQMIMYKLIKK